MSKTKIIIMKPIDNVGTVTEETVSGTDLMGIVEGNTLNIHVLEKIPFGHKVAIKDISKNEKIIKYGEVIGAATEDIKVGQYVHVHNLGGVRGRGDLPK